MEEIDLKELVKFFWSKKIIILLAIVVFAILGILYTKFCITPLYSASASLILVETEFENEADVAAYSKMAKRYSVLANSRTVRNKVIENLQLKMTLGELLSKMTVTNDPEAYNLMIKVTDTDPELVVKISDELANVVVEEIKNIYNDDKVQVLDYAIVDYEPKNINLTTNIIVFIVVGAILVCGYYLSVFASKKNENLKNNEVKN